jgi:Gram-negative bacterial TonB protein C-terminal
VADCLGLCSFVVASQVGWSESSPNASGFYIVSIGFSDVVPGWHRSVLELRPEGGDVLVRYICVVPSSIYCGKATRILETTARLPNTSLLAIAGGLNLCAIDPEALGRTIKAFPETQGLRAFAGDRYTIVANCGSNGRVIRLPGDWELDLARLKRKRPRIAALWLLEKTIGTRAFGPFPSIDVVPTEMAAQLRPVGEAILSELRSGKFDAGLAPRSFKEDVAALSDAPAFGVNLVNADHFRFDRYVDPVYPPFAKEARISGTVELEITSNPTTGETEQVTLVSGHPLLAQAATAAARHCPKPIRRGTLCASCWNSYSAVRRFLLLRER